MEWITGPFRVLAGFFEISVFGALGYIVGVIGFVFIPGCYKLLRELNAPKALAVPVAALASTYAGGLIIMLLFGGASGGGFDGRKTFGDVPTHAIAIERLDACPQATALIGKPIKLTEVGKGSYQTRGAFGTSSWNLEVAGSTGSAKVVYAAEMHGGKWGMTGLGIEVAGKRTDLASCMAATPATRVMATKDQLVGLWGNERGPQLVLTQLDADGTFVVGVFVNEKKMALVRGTWEVDKGDLIWRYDRARSDVPAAYWESLGEARIKEDRNPIVELTKMKLSIQEMSGTITEMRVTDPARLGYLLGNTAEKP